MDITRLDMDEWDRALPSGGFDVFQTSEALAVLDDHCSGDLQLFAGFKGEEPVAMLPVFLRESVLGRAAFSPPPSMAVPHMGPILMPTSPKRRKIERLNRDFSTGVIEELGAGQRFTLFRMVGGPEYPDPRPFEWADHSIDTRFTYVLEVPDDLDELLGEFSSDLRREIRQADEVDITVSTEGPSAADRVARDVISRYQEQGETAPFTVEYVHDLVDALGERARTYVARDDDGNYVGGIIVLYSNDKAYFWQGGVGRSYDGVSTNSLLHWRIIEDIAAGIPIESVDRYDLVGANTERLCEYKAKFGGELVPYYVVESNGRGMDLARRAYQLMHG
jgi:hypothetical protein